MSLKAFHIFFIVVATIFAAGLGVWALQRYLGPAGSGSDLFFAVLGFVAALGLLAYGRSFLKKMKDVSYL